MSAPSDDCTSAGLSPGSAAVHALSLTIAVLVAWYVATGIARHLSFMSGQLVLLSGMWTVVATAFVYREGFSDSRINALSRVAATGVSFVLTLVYLLLFPFTPWGLAIVIGLGALILDIIGRAQDSVTTSITTAVVMVVAALGPASQGWIQPILRLAETIIGVVIGLAAARITRRLLRGTGSPRPPHTPPSPPPR